MEKKKALPRAHVTLLLRTIRKFLNRNVMYNTHKVKRSQNPKMGVK